MQGIHEGTGAMPLPTLLAAVPSFIPVLLYICPAQAQQHASSALSSIPSSLLPAFFPLFFFSLFELNSITRRQVYTQNTFLSLWSPINETPSLHECLCVCVFNPHSQWVGSNGVFFFLPVVCFLSVCSRLHVWLCNSAIQTNILFLHPSHYSFTEGFAALMQCFLFYEGFIFFMQNSSLLASKSSSD